MSADRDLFLHEFIDINGMHQWEYMEHTLQQSGDEKVEFELLGTWYTMGITARWPQVVNIWEIPGGWDGWFGKVDRLIYPFQNILTKCVHLGMKLAVQYAVTQVDNTYPCIFPDGFLLADRIEYDTF